MSDERVCRWRARLEESGSLSDRRPGNGVHRLLAWEEAAILDLIEEWGAVDRSHRKLARPWLLIPAGCSCCRPRCCAARSNTRSGWRASRGVRGRWHPRFRRFGGSPTGSGSGTRPISRRARRVACAIVDVGSRYWIGYLLSAEQTSTQAQVLFTSRAGRPAAARRRRRPAAARWWRSDPRRVLR